MALAVLGRALVLRPLLGLVVLIQVQEASTLLGRVLAWALAILLQVARLRVGPRMLLVEAAAVPVLVAACLGLEVLQDAEHVGPLGPPRRPVAVEEAGVLVLLLLPLLLLVVR